MKGNGVPLPSDNPAIDRILEVFLLEKIPIYIISSENILRKLLVETLVVLGLIPEDDALVVSVILGEKELSAQPAIQLEKKAHDLLKKILDITLRAYTYQKESHDQEIQASVVSGLFAIGEISHEDYFPLLQILQNSSPPDDRVKTVTESIKTYLLNLINDRTDLILEYAQRVFSKKDRLTFDFLCGKKFDKTSMEEIAEILAEAFGGSFNLSRTPSMASSNVSPSVQDWFMAYLKSLSRPNDYEDRVKALSGLLYCINYRDASVDFLISFLEKMSHQDNWEVKNRKKVISVLGKIDCGNSEDTWNKVINALLSQFSENLYPEILDGLVFHKYLNEAQADTIRNLLEGKDFSNDEFNWLLLFALRLEVSYKNSFLQKAVSRELSRRGLASSKTQKPPSLL
jgi:hypothetical protein